MTMPIPKTRGEPALEPQASGLAGASAPSRSSALHAQPPSAPAKDGWTSRRRLLTALMGGTPDRVPINTYELAGRNSLDWYNQQPSYRGLMEYVRAHTDCITNWNPRPVTD